MFYTGCSAKSIHIQKSMDIHEVKASADFYYMVALDCEYRKDYLCSSSMFEKLYDITKQERFLKESTRFSLLTGRYDIYKKHIKKLESLATKDSEVASFLIPYYIKNKDYKSAEKITKNLLHSKKSKENYQLLVALYIDTKKYNKAQKVLNEYINEYGCEPKMCEMLLLVKTKLNDIDGTIKLLKRLYKATNNQTFEIELLKLYVSLGRFDDLEKYVKNSKTLNQDILLDIYSSLKDYKKAENISFDIYKEKKDPFYLADSAIFLYEAEYKKNHTVLKQVIKRFQNSVDKVKKPLFYNYYGYILIDHDVDIKKGIKYVKKALEIEPENEYYLDSLAWGYYKLGKCKKSLDILKQLNGQEQIEIKEHIKKVKECLKR